MDVSDTQLDTLPSYQSSSSGIDDLRDGIPFGPSTDRNHFYDEKNTKSATDTEEGEY